MSPPAVVEQQAKLGVPADESKAERLKRQQARFRDRGGAFVPSNSNPLVNILLARTVSGESPTKPEKDVPAKRRSLPKARHSSPTRKHAAPIATEPVQVVAASSKAKTPASRKRKAKAVDPEDAGVKLAPKRRGRPAKAKKTAPDPDCDAEQPGPPNTASKGKGTRHDTTSGPKSKLKAKAKSKQVVEVLDSDDDQTLVEVPRKAKSGPKRRVQCDDDGESDDDTPLLRKRDKPFSRASSRKTPVGMERDRPTDAVTKTSEDDASRTRDEKHSQSKKQMFIRDKDEDDSARRSRPKVFKLTSLQPRNPTSLATKHKECAEVIGKAKGKGRVKRDSNVVELLEEADEQLSERVIKPRKRKKGEDNHDDRPRKTVKFSEPALTHPSSQKLKENHPDEKCRSAVNASAPDKPHSMRKAATKPPSRTKASRGPPLEVLERIKAGAARHLRYVDSEPDELDCLS